MKGNLMLAMALLIGFHTYAGDESKNKLAGGEYVLAFKKDGSERQASLNVAVDVRDAVITMSMGGSKEKLTGALNGGGFILEKTDKSGNIIYEGVIDAKGEAGGSWRIENGGLTAAKGTFTLQRRAASDLARDEAVAALNANDFKAAYDKFLPLAEAGDDKAMVTIGLMYQEGRGFQQDYGKAMDWYVRAFKNRNGDAYSNIGVMYRDGLGVGKNRKMAYCLFLITHVCSLGTESTQYRANSCLRKLLPEMSKEELAECFNCTLEYVQAYVESKGSREGLLEEHGPSKDRVALKDKPWWVKGELDFLK